MFKSGTGSDVHAAMCCISRQVSEGLQNKLYRLIEELQSVLCCFALLVLLMRQVHTPQLTIAPLVA